MIRVAVDAMGGKEAPGAPVEAALAALGEDPRLEVLLVGRLEELEQAVGSRGAEPRLQLVAAEETVGMDEPPVRAVRGKRDSSIVVAIGLLADREVGAVVSAGSTGAVVAASVLGLERLEGVDRPAVAALVPTARDPVLVLDVGANPVARSRHLHQFAHLGTVYVRDLLGADRPVVGLLNIGEEASKGDRTLVEAHRLLQDDPALDFVGNVEGNEIVQGACDVLVCDGFTGNVLLKFYESIAGFMAELIAEAAGEHESESLDQVLRLLDYTEYGGAPLLGVEGLPVLCHGASPPRAIRNAIVGAASTARAGLVRHLAEEMAV